MLISREKVVRMPVDAGKQVIAIVMFWQSKMNAAFPVVAFTVLKIYTSITKIIPFESDSVALL